MGDRKGLTRLDRTNGFDDGRDYMRVKKSKLAQQNDQIRDALRNRNESLKTDIFKGISINVNGRTQPTADELKRLVLLNGGDYHPYYRYKTTKFMIATNLSSARVKQLRPDDRVIRPEWITESVELKCLLPYEDYQLFADELRGKTGTVLGLNEEVGMITSGTSSRADLELVGRSHARKNLTGRNKEAQTVSKNRDIRSMMGGINCGSSIGERSLSLKPIGERSLSLKPIGERSLSFKPIAPATSKKSTISKSKSKDTPRVKNKDIREYLFKHKSSLPIV